MKLLIVSNMYPSKRYPSYGTFVKNFCDQLGQAGIPYSLGVMRQSRNRLEKIGNYLKFYAGVTLRLLFGNYDTVYVHYASHSSIPVLLAAHLRKLKIITNVHGSDVIPENQKQEKMQKYTEAILKKSAQVVVPSEYFKQIVCHKYHVEESKVSIYPSGGVDPKLFHPVDPEDCVETAGQLPGRKEDRPLFGMVGRISAGKGWDTFVRAIQILEDRGAQADYVIVGDGVESPRLEQMTDDCGLEKRIIRLGLLPQSKLPEVYSLLDYFVFPTKREGESLGLVALEAMACGTPVISSDYAAPAYYIQQGENGFKFPVDDAQALAECMEKSISVWRERTAYEKMVEHAIHTASAYEPEKLREKLVEIMNR